MGKVIGFIGTGSMGGILAQTAGKSGMAEKILLCDKDVEKASALAAQIKGASVREIVDVIREADYLFLGVKPQVLPDLLISFKSEIAGRKGNQTIVSMAAGVSMDTVCRLCGTELPLIRIMPNTSAAVGEGVILYCGRNVSDANIEFFKSLLAPAGIVDPLPEHLIDAASALTGCGPAFVYLFLEALADGAVACGLPRDKALQYAAATVKGAGAMALETGKHPGQLKDAVTSPGGTTIEGVRKLEESGFRAAAMDAVIASYKKTLELKKGQ